MTVAQFQNRCLVGDRDHLQPFSVFLSFGEAIARSWMEMRWTDVLYGRLCPVGNPSVEFTVKELHVLDPDHIVEIGGGR